VTQHHDRPAPSGTGDIVAAAEAVLAAAASQGSVGPEPLPGQPTGPRTRPRSPNPRRNHRRRHQHRHLQHSAGPEARPTRTTCVGDGPTNMAAQDRGTATDRGRRTCRCRHRLRMDLQPGASRAPLPAGGVKHPPTASGETTGTGRGAFAPGRRAVPADTHQALEQAGLPHRYSHRHGLVVHRSWQRLRPSASLSFFDEQHWQGPVNETTRSPRSTQATNRLRSVRALPPGCRP